MSQRGESGHESKPGETGGASSTGSVAGPLSPHGSERRPPAGDALPETYGVDEVGVLCKDPWWYFAYWEVTEAGLDAARAQLGAAAEGAKLVLRVLAAATGERRGRDPRDIRDVPVDITQRHGRRYLEAPRPNAVFRVALGLLSPEGLFAPIAHSTTVRMPPQQPSSETSIEWLHVLPTRGDGRQRERIVSSVESHSERSVSWRVSERGEDAARRDGNQKDELRYASPDRAGGSSDLGPRDSGGRAKDREVR